MLLLYFCYAIILLYLFRYLLSSEKEKERMNIMPKDDNLEEMMKEKRREYFRQWRAKNKDKVRQHNLNYWMKKAQQEAQKGENHA